MSVKLSLNLSQKLIISQKMYQSMKLLSLSHEELKTLIQKELLKNPLLEEATNISIKSENNLTPRETLSYDKPHSNYKNQKVTSTALLEDFVTEPESLKTYVLEQAKMSFFSRKIKIVLSFLISYLDERGYLRLDLNELAEKEQIPKSLLNSALKALQSLEPAGVGGRNLEECLIIQLKRKKENTKKACLIVQNHLENLKSKKYRTIAYDLNLSLKEVEKLSLLIKSLEPNPARNFSSQPTVFASPDIYIFKDNGTYKVSLNQTDLPELKCAHNYNKAIRKMRLLKPEESQYLKNKLTEAYWFIQAIQQRQHKIELMAYYLINHQRDFLDKGIRHLRPLRMQSLADKMSLHVSTISRIANNKYAHTPQGLFPLKIFFQKGLITEEGTDISVLKVKEAIKKWVQEEDPMQPLTDNQIKEKIYQKFQLCLLKRSISQYRADMDIPPFKDRKRLFAMSQSLSL